MASSANVVAELLGGLMNQNSTGRAQHALGAQGLGAANNPLAGILGQLQSGMGGTNQRGSGGSGGGLMGMAMQVLGGMQRNPAAAGGAGALAGMLLGGGGGAVRGGALALLGSLAASALSQSGRQPAPTQTNALPGSMRAFNVDPAEDRELTDRADLILEAMVNAAKADGVIDQEELQRIEAKLREDGLEQAEVDQFHRLVEGPLDLDGMVAKIRDPQTAAEIYAASAMAITIDTEAERQYLQVLAQRTGLDAQTVASLHQMLGINA